MRTHLRIHVQDLLRATAGTRPSEDSSTRGRVAKTAARRVQLPSRLSACLSVCPQCARAMVDGMLGCGLMLSTDRGW
jgi:hypothetical protein